ncbi:MAG: PLP-dependent aminotransferase family protein [Myxococcales bacterium]|nr:PLP-dependent aminotransferase family protein [Myxococcales bacterium]
MELELDRRSHVSLPQQLVQQVVLAIRSGRLPPGASLPGTRTMAETLGVHRNTVIAAVEELEAQGWLQTRQGLPSRVTSSLPLSADVAVATPKTRLGFPVRPWPGASRAFEAVPKGVLDFSAGLPDPRLFDAAALARAYRRSLRQTKGQLLGFGHPAGDERLRRALASQLASRRGLAVTADDVLITRGSQLAMHLLALALTRPGDSIAVEAPGYPSSRDAFACLGVKVMPIRVDGEGLDVEQLSRARALKAVLVTPHLQDPTTVTLSARRRLALLELARRRRFAVIELDTDFEFTFDGPPVLPLASQDTFGVVVYVGTLSKALAPGLRTGFVVAPPALRDTLLAVRGQVDRTGDAGLERALAQMVEDGEVQRHSLKARRVFLARRDLLVELLRRQLGGTLTFDVPRGGLGLWAHVDPALDVEAWAARALQAGVRFFPGRAFSPTRRRLPNLRLGFANLNETELVDAVRRLAQAR